MSLSSPRRARGALVDLKAKPCEATQSGLTSLHSSAATLQGGPCALLVERNTHARCASAEAAFVPRSPARCRPEAGPSGGGLASRACPPPRGRRAESRRAQSQSGVPPPHLILLSHVQRLPCPPCRSRAPFSSSAPSASRSSGTTSTTSAPPRRDVSLAWMRESSRATRRGGGRVGRERETSKFSRAMGLALASAASV